jgi:hypothetical protein
MQIRQFIGLLIGCLLLVGASRRAAGDNVDDSGLWLAMFGNGGLHADGDESPWRWWFDGQLRYFDDFDGFGQSLIRPGVGYQLSEKLTVWTGYAWIHTSPQGRPFDEQRLWQQLTWSEKLDPATLDLRSRLEQRFVETGSDTGWRFRQMVALRRPLASTPQYTLVAWDELFFHLNDTDWGARDGFDQNRLFLGAGWKPTPECAWRLEFGYLHQFIDRAGQRDVANHLLSLNLFWNP